MTVSRESWRVDIVTIGHRFWLFENAQKYNDFNSRRATTTLPSPPFPQCLALPFLDRVKCCAHSCVCGILVYVVVLVHLLTPILAKKYQRYAQRNCFIMLRFMLAGESEVSVIIFTLTIELGLTGWAENTPLKIWTSCPKMFFFWGGGQIGEGVVRYWPPTNSFLLFVVLTSVPILVKIDQEMRPCESARRRTDRQTHTQTHRRKPIL